MERYCLVRYFDLKSKKIIELKQPQINDGSIDSPIYAICGKWNAGCLIDSDQIVWLKTKGWVVEPYGLYPNFYVTDYRGVRKFILYNRVLERGGVNFILYLLATYETWQDFEGRANGVDKNFELLC